MKRRVFAQFYTEVDGKIVPKLGSTGVTTPMDGRWGLESCHRYARSIADQHNQIGEDPIVGYRLIFGEGYREIQHLSGVVML